MDFDPIKFTDIYNDLQKYEILDVSNEFKTDNIIIKWNYNNGFGQTYRLRINIRNLATNDNNWTAIYWMTTNNDIEHRKGPWDFVIEQIYDRMVDAIASRKKEEQRQMEEKNKEEREFVDAWARFASGHIVRDL